MSDGNGAFLDRARKYTSPVDSASRMLVPTSQTVARVADIDYIPQGELDLPEDIIRCSLGPVPSTSWMDDGILPDEEDDSIWIR